jgi:uncharacterized protein (TIGR02996 family)
VTPAAGRRRYDAWLEQLRAYAGRAFRRRPELRSLLVAVARHGGERGSERGSERGDEVHALVISSPRAVPAWPHFCEMYSEDEGLSAPGDGCNQRCDLQLGELAAPADALARFCHQHGAPDHPDAERFTPLAIARRRAGAGAGDLDIELEFIGKLWRPEDDLVPDEPEAGRRWLDLPRARALYALVCASPADDEPRRVLGDHLLEHGHPRGELIALSLAGPGAATPAAIARQGELLAAYGRPWLSPLGAVIPESGAGWARGFLARADVHVHSPRAVPAEVRGAPAWGTVEAIRFLRADLIDPAMVALRAVGPVREGGLLELAAAARPWAIERLHAVLEEPQAADALWDATTLPRLSHLALEGPFVAAALARPRPRWWSRLARLTLILDCDATAAAQESIRRTYAGIAPWVAVTRRSAITCDLGWQVASGPAGPIELSLAGWHEAATSFALWEIVDALPPGAAIELVPSRRWAPLPEDAERLAAVAGRPIRLG